MIPTGAHYRSATAGRLILLPLFLSALLPSCGVIGSSGKAEEEAAAKPYGPTGIPPELRSRASASVEGEAIIPGGNLPLQAPPADMTPEEDIFFTDPDNPSAIIPELATLLSAPARGPWEQSESVARQRAAREGKPLMIWFTDSVRSPMCKALSQELFSTPEFETWANEKLVRLRVDANTRVIDPKFSQDSDDRMNREVELRNYVRELKKRYKVLGHPSVVVLNPSGEVIARPRGYKRGQADYFWGLIKHAEAVSSTAHQSWKAALEKKGYRDWSDKRNRTIFAKLANYANGELVLIEPDGTRSRTQEKYLSREDQDWIAHQKRLRNID